MSNIKNQAGLSVIISLNMKLTKHEGYKTREINKKFFQLVPFKET